MIPFNVPPYIGTEMKYVQEAVDAHKICGDGAFTKKCHAWIEERFNASKVLLTTSGTSALEMATILCGLKAGDEVILPSYTFSSTATAVVLTSAVPVFVDVRPDTMNIDETKIEAAITGRTKAIIAVHYAGVACEMDTIMDIAARYKLKVIEDAAQGVMSTYKGRALGTIADFGCYSFHETKNYSMGEGGAILLNNAPTLGGDSEAPEASVELRQMIEHAEILREKGTNRSKFYRGEIDKYTWMDMGSSYLPSDILAAYLWAQLEIADEIFDKRMAIWNRYYEELKPLQDMGIVELPIIPETCKHNAHIFYVKTRNLDERTRLINYMKDNDILAVFHYIPLHISPAGKKFGEFRGEDKYTTKESERLVRLPLYFDLDESTQGYIISKLKQFYGQDY